MAVTIVGSLSIATAGKAEVRTVMVAALGCNIAWGLVDAVMYLIRAATERSRLRVLDAQVRASDRAGGRRLIESAVPEHLNRLLSTDEIEAMRERLVAGPVSAGPLLTPRTVGWKFSGGEAVTFEVTPIIGGMFGSARGFVPGVEASVAWRQLDAYIEAEYVNDRTQPGTSYYYAWSELAWSPTEWLRAGFVGQRTRTVHDSAEIDRGLFAQVTMDRVTFSVYAFNPDSSSRYLIGALGVRF